ncbi:hypothetical protein ACH42_01335 [Endozoicomonas sp. (ex Bugula neritina AB1)]|nr:hypothetical protein ACH42_01335 [Endozoicomonas sp. (ex Bugula neritina AB1)]
MTNLVLFSELPTNNQKKIGIVTLNSEKTLNALNLSMIDQLYDQLLQWQCDDSVVCVFMEGKGSKAFCAGGDVRSLRDAVSNGDDQSPKRFFGKEYRLDYLIHTYLKPVICWGNGIVMGGGLGLMAGADFRVVTDTTMMAMPEISIGLYPDVAGSWLLGRMPKGIGLFMALTGCRLNAADAMYLGLANRYIDHAFRDNVLSNLQQADWEGSHYETVYEVIHHFTQNSAGWLPYSKIREHRDLIIGMMDRPSVTDSMAALTALETDDAWLSKARDTALKGSPLSAAIGFLQLKRSEHMSLKEVFLSELVLSVNTVLHGDFCEGVRALLVDKDGQPEWKYASVEAVDQEHLEQLFVSPWGNRHPLEDI